MIVESFQESLYFPEYLPVLTINHFTESSPVTVLHILTNYGKKIPLEWSPVLLHVLIIKKYPTIFPCVVTNNILTSVIVSSIMFSYLDSNTKFIMLTLNTYIYAWMCGFPQLILFTGI